MKCYITIKYSTVQYSTVQYSTVQYSTVQYSTSQYIKCSTSPHYFSATPHCITQQFLEPKSVTQPNISSLYVTLIQFTSLLFTSLHLISWTQSIQNQNQHLWTLYLGYQDMDWLLFGISLDPPISVRWIQVAGIEAARDAALKE